ncbi:TPA: fimbria/pilus periplasmic chaperone [Citrobacter werkmanii]|nr:fimbria/pilus periplasmic chaperone [Citrobacter werkmanii]
MKIKHGVLALILSGLISTGAQAALVMDATRYIFKGDQPAISVTVENTSDKLFGGQVWLDNITEKDTRPSLVATPSFFRIKGKERQVFRVIRASEHVPQDKESVYWLNLQDIPPAREGSGISVAMRTRVKVFYRPASLVRDRVKAEERLQVESRDGRTVLKNPTPYVFVIGSLLDAKDRVLTLTQAQQEKLTLFMPGDTVDITGLNVSRVSALSDLGALVTYTIGKKA